MSLPLPPVRLLRGSGTHPFRMSVRSTSLSLAISEASKSKMLVSLDDSQVWVGQQALSTRSVRTYAEISYVLGLQASKVARQRHRVRRIWLEEIVVDGHPHSAEISRSLLIFREAVRGLLAGGLHVEMDVDKLYKQLQSCTYRTFATILDPLDRCGVELNWPTDEDLRGKIASALLWSDNLERATTDQMLDEVNHMAQLRDSNVEDDPELLDEIEADMIAERNFLERPRDEANETAQLGDNNPEVYSEIVKELERDMIDERDFLKSPHDEEEK